MKISVWIISYILRAPLYCFHHSSHKSLHSTFLHFLLLSSLFCPLIPFPPPSAVPTYQLIYLLSFYPSLFSFSFSPSLLSPHSLLFPSPSHLISSLLSSLSCPTDWQHWSELPGVHQRHEVQLDLETYHRRERQPLQGNADVQEVSYSLFLPAFLFFFVLFFF